MGIFCYQHHINDWRASTAHLTLLQRGVYREMIDWYYATNGKLLADHKKISRLIGAESRQEKDAIKFIMVNFFCSNPAGFLQQNRCETELLKIKNKSEKASKSAKIKHLASANAERTQSERTANQEPITNSYESDTRVREDFNLLEAHTMFEDFWQKFPSKTCRKDAIVAYTQARKKGITHETIISGVERYVKQIAGRSSQHIANPARWLDGERWSDEFTDSTAPRPTFNGKTAYGDSIANAARAVADKLDREAAERGLSDSETRI